MGRAGAADATTDCCETPILPSPDLHPPIPDAHTHTHHCQRPKNLGVWCRAYRRAKPAPADANAADPRRPQWQPPLRHGRWGTWACRPARRHPGIPVAYPPPTIINIDEVGQYESNTADTTTPPTAYRAVPCTTSGDSLTADVPSAQSLAPGGMSNHTHTHTQAHRFRVPTHGRTPPPSHIRLFRRGLGLLLLPRSASGSPSLCWARETFDVRGGEAWCRSATAHDGGCWGGGCMAGASGVGR